MSAFWLGLDLASVSLDSVVVGEGGEILWSEYTRIHGRPLDVAHDVLSRILQKFPARDIAACCVTGSGAGRLASLLGATEINEILALTRGVDMLHPETRAVIDMGGEDAKMILVSPDGHGGLCIDDFAMNTMCAAGTGSFLDQQSHRLGFTIEEFSAQALKSENPPRLAGRCSVFAKTDMIHLQQEATPDHDIMAGLCFAVARNLKSNIAKGKRIVPPVCFTGGVAANRGVQRALSEILELEPGQLIVPEMHGCVGALGAALEARDKGERRPLTDLSVLAAHAAEVGKEARRLKQLKLSAGHQTAVACQPPQGPLQGYLGVDVGSISTNVVVIDEHLNVLSKQYLMTAGRPLEAVKQGLAQVGREIGDRVTILGAGTTGSGRFLTADFIGADIVKNEITAQATAAAALDPTVDTIFEIGGQDSKYISLSNGAIVDFNMNKVCAAGTGSFLEEQAEKLGISIRGEFGDRALAAPEPVAMGERCTVFMESDLVAHQAAGAGLDDLVAGLSYSIVYNYLNKVVEDRTVGSNIFYQGATAANKGIVAAFEAVLGRSITVPAYHDVTGAIGAAILAMRERTWEQSSFKGFVVSESNYQISTFECKGCPNTCAIRKVTVEGEKHPLFYGSRCEKYDVDRSRSQAAEHIPDLFAEREELLLSYTQPVDPKRLKGRVAIPRAMFFREYLPFFSAFCQSLGVEVTVSGPSTKKLIHAGVEVVVNEPCFPIKVAHGHLRELMAGEVDDILLPAIISMDAPGHELGYGQACPYSQTLCYTAPAGLDLADAGKRLITAPIHFGYGKKRLLEGLKLLAQRMGVGRGGVARAMEAGLAAQADFRARLLARGREVLGQIGPDERAMVVVGRPYNGADPGINLGLPQKMRQLGVWALPMDCLDTDALLPRPELAEMYWRYGQKILAAAAICREDPRLHPVYITNFGCGPDSFIGHFFRQSMGGKPFLEIEVDEHSADVGAITRLEAFLDSLPNAKPPAQEPAAPPRRSVAATKRVIYIPAMSDHAQTIAAAFRACGAESQSLPESDERTLELGRRYTSGRECYPCALTTGDMLRALMDKAADPDKSVFFMPSGTGPCRFGQYHRFHRLVLDELGFSHVPIFAPDQSEVLYKELGMMGGGDFTRLAWQGVVGVDLLQKGLHETRPYEAEPGAADRVYQKHLAELCRAIEDRGDLAGCMLAAREQFSALPRSATNHKPRVGVVGEIYTRANRFANENVVKVVEELGGEAWMASIGEWILYTNLCSMWRARRLGKYRDLWGTMIENFFQYKDEHHLGKPWEGYLKTLHEPKVSRLLNLATPYLDRTFEGEAILSISKSRSMYQEGANGVINLIPFACMPGNISTALMKRLREDNGNLPILTLAMDGQQLAGGRMRLEAFIHQVTQFRDRREDAPGGRG